MKYFEQKRFHRREINRHQNPFLFLFACIVIFEIIILLPIFHCRHTLTCVNITPPSSQVALEHGYFRRSTRTPSNPHNQGCCCSLVTYDVLLTNHCRFAMIYQRNFCFFFFLIDASFFIFVVVLLVLLLLLGRFFVSIVVFFHSVAAAELALLPHDRRRLCGYRHSSHFQGSRRVCDP